MLVSLQAVVSEEREGEGWQVHAGFNVGYGFVGVGWGMAGSH